MTSTPHLTGNAAAASRRAAETNAMTFLPPAKRADTSKNFSRSAPRTTSKRKTIR